MLLALALNVYTCKERYAFFFEVFFLLFVPRRELGAPGLARRMCTPGGREGERERGRSINRNAYTIENVVQ